MTINRTGDIPAGIRVVNGTGAIWTAAGTIINNGTIEASGGSTAAIRIQSGLHTNNGSITGNGVTAIERSAAASGIAQVANNAGATIGSTGVANAIVDLGTGTFTIINRGTISGGVSMGPGIDNLNLYPGSTITGSINGGSDASVDALSLYGPGDGTINSIVSGFETLTVNGGRWTLNDAITGVTSSSIQNGGTLVLTSSSSSISGQMFILSGGTLETNAANLPTSTLDNRGTVRFQQPAGTVTFSRTLSGSGAVEKSGPGTLIFSGANTYTGGTTISGGTLQIGNGGVGGTITGRVVNNGNLAFNRSDAVSYGGTISGTGSVTQAGSGTLTLTGANSYSGGTVLDAGTVVAHADSALGASSGSLTFNGGTFRFGSGFNLSAGRAVSINGAGGTIDTNGFSTTIGGIVSGSGTLTKTGGGTLTLTANSPFSGALTIGQGSVQLGNGGAAGSVSGNIANNGNLIFNRSDAFTFGGTIAGTGSVTQAGSGITILTGNNTYTGGTTIAQGTLQIGNGGTSGAITGNVANNGTLTFNRADSYTFGGMISGAGSVTQAGPGTTILTGDSTYTGGTTITQGTLQLGNGGTSGSIAGNVTNSGNLTFNRADNYTFGGVVSGAGSVTQAGSGTTILTGDSTYTGGTTITQGTLQLGNGGTSGSIAGNVTNSGNLTFNRANNYTFGGVVSGAGSVTQAGPGTTILTGANTYSGGTTIAQGTLQLGNGGTSGAIAGNVTNSGNLTFNRADPLTFGGVISGSGAVSQSGSGTTILSEVQTYTGATRVSDGTLALGAPTGAPGGLAGSGPVTIDTGGTMGGYGSVSGRVTNGGTILVANALDAFADGPNGDLRMTAGLINMGVLQIGGRGVGNTATVAGDYVGQGGTIGLNTVLGTDNSRSDRLVVDGGRATGPSRLAIRNAGGEGAFTTGNGIRVIDAVNGGRTAADAFALAGPVLAGPYQYTLFRGAKDGTEPDDWFLRSEQPVPPTPEPNYRIETSLYAALAGQALTYGRQMVGSLHERMGDVWAAGPWPEGTTGRAWGRLVGYHASEDGHDSASGKDNPAYSFGLYGLQGGIDMWRHQDADGRQSVGLFGAIGGSNGSVSTHVGERAGTSDFAAYTAGGYWTILGTPGWYIDTVAQTTLYDLNARSVQDVHLDTGAAGLAGSIEGGYPLALSDDLVFEPQVQFVGQSLWVGNTSDGFADIGFDVATSLAGRVGGRIAHTASADNPLGVPMTTWARADIWHEWLDATPAVSFSSEDGPVEFYSNTDNTCFAFRAGFSSMTSKHVELQASAGLERSLDGSSIGFDGKFGLVVTW
ncbi:MAG: autotransporter-associated beta strand repeat-containing protein [Hyphomicrobiales bacterium]